MVESGIPRIARFVFLLLLAMSVSIAMSAQTATTQKGTSKKTTVTAKKAAPAQATEAQPGQRAFIDPVTKQAYQPSVDELKALNPTKKTLKAAPAPKLRDFGNGVRGVAVPEDSMSYAVATKSPDGKVNFGCVDSKKKADQVVKSGTPVQNHKEALDEK